MSLPSPFNNPFLLSSLLPILSRRRRNRKRLSLPLLPWTLFNWSRLTFVSSRKGNKEDAAALFPLAWSPRGLTTITRSCRCTSWQNYVLCCRKYRWNLKVIAVFVSFNRLFVFLFSLVPYSFRFSWQNAGERRGGGRRMWEKAARCCSLACHNFYNRKHVFSQTESITNLLCSYFIDETRFFLEGKV